MNQFMGTHRNRLDAKLRVSVPAAFRGVLKLHGSTMVLRSSHLYPCIEGWPEPVFDGLANSLQRLDVFSDTQDSLAASLYASACVVEADKEGRVVLPNDLVAEANLADSVLFIGLGRNFQIWEPEAGAKFVAQARERARAGALTLPGTGAPVHG
jgi:MraZ protein